VDISDPAEEDARLLLEENNREELPQVYVNEQYRGVCYYILFYILFYC